MPAVTRVGSPSVTVGIRCDERNNDVLPQQEVSDFVIGAVQSVSPPKEKIF